MRAVSFKWLLFFLVAFTTTMGVPNNTKWATVSTVSGDYETYFYPQTLDHFNYEPQGYNTFRQRYIINRQWWGGASSNAPIFVFFGAEQPIDSAIEGIGFLPENAPVFRALLVYIEHRFYGLSNPAGSMETSLRDVNLRGYFNSAQALADYAEILRYLRDDQFNAHDSPIIVVGGSYGGMLAAWFRLKYPHLAFGALASSAPILYLDNITPQDGYYSVVTKDFRETSENCYTTIKNSWAEIDRVASTPYGLATLSQKFRSCSPLINANELKNYLENTYTRAAQYGVPPYTTTRICQAIDSASGSFNILDRIFAGISVLSQGGVPCINTASVSKTSIGWEWQKCSEMVMPMGATSEASMFQRSPFNLQSFTDDCRRSFGVTPRARWATTYYGGHDIRSVLSKSGSNIIFSNGLRDPYSSGGVLEDISDTIIAVKTTDGSHCQDLSSSTATDPTWLVNQRREEAQIIKKWLNKH